MSELLHQIGSAEVDSATAYEVDAIDRQRQGAVRLMWSSVVFRQGEYMSKLLLCATVLTGTAAAGTLVLLVGAAAAGGAAVVCCCRRSQRTPASGSAEADQRGSLREQQ